MLNWDVAGCALPLSDGDVAVWVAPILGSAAFSPSSKRSYKKRTEVAVSGGKGLKGCMQLPVEVACAIASL